MLSMLVEEVSRLIGQQVVLLMNISPHVRYDVKATQLFFFQWLDSPLRV
jgi:hypothetical protein